MDVRFDENEQMLHDLCTRFAREQLTEAGAEADRAGATPPELIAKGLELGLLLDAIPAAHGGYLEGDFNYTARTIRTLALARGCPAVTLRFEANTEYALAATAIGGQEAKLTHLAEAAGQVLAAVVWSDSRKPLHIAAGKLNGRVGAVPNAAGAAYLAVVGFVELGTPFVALVDTASEGVTVTPVKSMGLRAAAVADVEFVDVKPQALVEADAAVDLVRRLRNGARLLAGALGVGAALRALENAEAYAADRIQFGQPIGTFEALARLLHENRARLHAAESFLLTAAQALDHGQNADTICREAGSFAGEVAVRAAIDAVQIYGGYGFVNDYPVEKVMRDVRACTTLAGDGLEELVMIQAGR